MQIQTCCTIYDIHLFTLEISELTVTLKLLYSYFPDYIGSYISLRFQMSQSTLGTSILLSLCQSSPAEHFTCRRTHIFTLKSKRVSYLHNFVELPALPGHLKDACKPIRKSWVKKLSTNSANSFVYFAARLNVGGTLHNNMQNCLTLLWNSCATPSVPS